MQLFKNCKLRNPQEDVTNDLMNMGYTAKLSTGFVLVLIDSVT